MINDPRADEIIVGIRGLMRSFRIRPWDPGTDRGFVKHVLVRIGRNTGEILVNIVGAVPMFPKKRDFTAALVKKFPAIKTVTYSVNRSPEFLTLGDHAETLYGDGYIAAILLSGESAAGGKAVFLRGGCRCAEGIGHAPGRVQRHRHDRDNRLRPR